MTCGDGTFGNEIVIIFWFKYGYNNRELNDNLSSIFLIIIGCLGHGDWQSLSAPKLVESLLTVDVSAVACGTGHVVIVGRKGDVYSWGRGSLGRLGTGNGEDCCIPQAVMP